MNNKLTLRMDESLIASAKNYAAAHGGSVSQMVANYFAALVAPPAADSAEGDATSPTRGRQPSAASGPVTRSLVGLLKPPEGQKPLTKDDYNAYLERKHLGSHQKEQSS
jgi:Family of unknown function (DUF6364)